MTTLGQRIREHRRRAGLSQEALARRMDVSRQAVTKWESGPERPQHGEPLPPGGALRHHGGPAAPIRGGGRSGGRGTSTPVVPEPPASPGPGGSGGDCGVSCLLPAGPHPLVPPGGQLPAGLAAVGAAQRRGELSLRLAPQQRSLLVGHGPLRPDGAAGAVPALLHHLRLFSHRIFDGAGSGAPPAGSGHGTRALRLGLLGMHYLLSLPMGLLAERAGRKGVTFASRRGRLLAAGLVLCPLLSAVLAALAKAP